MSSSYLPGYKGILTAVGASYVLLASSMLVQGAARAMQPFGLPEVVLKSAHFADLFHFYYVLMVVIGLLFFALGRYVREGREQRHTARLLLLIDVYVVYLDLRTSDSPLGNGLYKGPGTVMPGLIGVVIGLAFAYLSFRALRPREKG